MFRKKRIKNRIKIIFITVGYFHHTIQFLSIFYKKKRNNFYFFKKRPSKMG